jgi:hypothetical protein
MEHLQSLTHTKWECKYHIVWIPKYRKKKLYGQIRKFLGMLFKELASQTGVYDYRRAFTTGPCPHFNLDTSEICCFASSWVSQRQKRHSSSPSLFGAKKEFQWPEFLGSGLFCFNRGQR